MDWLKLEQILNSISESMENVLFFLEDDLDRIKKIDFKHSTLQTIFEVEKAFIPRDVGAQYSFREIWKPLTVLQDLMWSKDTANLGFHLSDC